MKFVEYCSIAWTIVGEKNYIKNTLAIKQVQNRVTFVKQKANCSSRGLVEDFVENQRYEKFKNFDRTERWFQRNMINNVVG